MTTLDINIQLMYFVYTCNSFSGVLPAYSRKNTERNVCVTGALFSLFHIRCRCKIEREKNAIFKLYDCGYYIFL
jgi:hypothetical protein